MESGQSLNSLDPGMRRDDMALKICASGRRLFSVYPERVVPKDCKITVGQSGQYLLGEEEETQGDDQYNDSDVLGQDTDSRQVVADLVESTKFAVFQRYTSQTTEVGCSFE
ncbi:MAG: hypothetical protein KZQ88_15245, partial [Candidatus Thiodiazotropha sp. (ex Dulcina madagascariensis)]|nr:hypothetical protein [Candidatus Thiodiazotropha sp. (ex Dulcina madagascariensis)]